jgi:hypothetical protein
MAIATVYQHSNFGGRALNLSAPGDYNYGVLNQYGFNDFISSIKVNSGYVVELYTDANFKGVSATVNNSYTYVGDALNDKISSIKVYNALYGDSNNNYLQGTGSNDYISGQNGNDVLTGQGGNDKLFGGNGDDRLSGSSNPGYNSGEYDTLIGGSGKDIFGLAEYQGQGKWDTYYQGNGYATIVDYNPQEDFILTSSADVSCWSKGFGNWVGSSALDTGLYKDGDLIGVIQDQIVFVTNPNI